MYRISIILLFISFSGLSQSTSYKVGIKNNFTMPAISAYQERSMDRIADFYQYLEIVSDPSQPVSLKTQAKENIKSLVFDTNLIIRNFTSDDLAMTFDQLLERVGNKGLKFKILDKGTFSAIGIDFWVNSYTLQITEGKQVSVKSITQKIYFAREYKRFGDADKEVWSIELGEIE